MGAARAACPSQDPTRVNQRTAWVRTADTARSGTDWRLTVDTAARPTPPGPQFVVGTFWAEPGTTTPRVVLLSSQSETMDAYDTRTRTSATAFHSTTLRSRGEVSNGCVRLADDVLDVLWRTVPAGTLVVVR